jgi:hypothetical protein
MENKMKTAQVKLNKGLFSKNDLEKIITINPHMVTVFGATKYFEDKTLGIKLKEFLPNSHIIGCSTAGEISQDGVSDNSLVITGVHFKAPQLKSVSTSYSGIENSKKGGEDLAKKLSANDLNGIFVLGQGININGSDLISGIQNHVSNEVIITGGLAGDAADFKNTFVLCNETVEQNIIAGIGFYGKNLTIGFGSMGGWEPFGPVRKVTQAKANVLFTLDNEPALNVYKKYLGDQAKGLPGTGLLFPFALLKENGDQTGLIRTILSVDETKGSLTFAGDIPENSIVRLMTARANNLVNGASGAAQWALNMLGDKKTNNDFAILVSCVGRKLVMADAIEDEIDAVKNITQSGTITGFYSYGEICPFGFVKDCKLHNQTMTITYFSEN